MAIINFRQNRKPAMMKQNVCFGAQLGGPAPIGPGQLLKYNKVNQPLGRLSYMLEDRKRYLDQLKHKTIVRKIRKVQRNYESYIEALSRKPVLLIAANDMGAALAKMMNQKLRHFFACARENKVSLEKQSMKHITFNEGSNFNQVLAEQNLKYKLVVSVINKILTRTTVQLLSHSFTIVKQHKDQHREAKLPNLSSMRIIETTPQVCSQLQICDQNGQYEFLNMSEFTSRSTLVTNKRIAQANEKAQLLDKILELEAQHQRRARYYEEIKHELGMEIEASSHYPKNAPSSPKSRQSGRICRNANPPSTADLSMSASHKSQPQQTEAALRAFVERNTQLQQEVDQVLSNLEHLIEMSAHEPNINPELVLVLRQAREVLAPNPLGRSVYVG